MQASMIVLTILFMYPSDLSANLHVKRERTHCTDCNFNPCLNGGTCVESTGLEFICTCQEGFTGDICESDICDNHDCKNGGICVVDQSVIRGYTCNCATGFVGDNCEAGVCDRHVCLNGGVCEADQTIAQGYKCYCVTGYTGDNCEVGVCESHVCMNGGLCEADQTSVRGYKCNCVYGNVGDNCQVLAIDCKVYRDIGNTESGVYDIYPFGPSSESVKTYCDMETLDGGWTAIQKRIDRSLSFDKKWLEYKRGFGAPEHSYWIGNDVIHQLTKGNDSSLFVSITLINGTKLYELYDRFSVSTEENNYQLFIGGPATGTLGDSMLNPIGPEVGALFGMYFTTSDRDNDLGTLYNCADVYRGAWWFNRCHRAFLNGPWSLEGRTLPELPWYPAIEAGTAVRETIMMIKRQ